MKLNKTSWKLNSKMLLRSN